MKKRTVLLLLLTAALSLSACSGQRGNSAAGGSYKEETAGTAPTASFSDYENITFPSEPYDDSEFFGKDSLRRDGGAYTEISVSVPAYDSFVSYLRGIETDYSYSDYYKIEEAAGKYEAVLPVLGKITHSNLLETITPESVYERVTANNKQYKENLPSYMTSFYEDLDEKNLRTYCTVVAQATNYYLSKNVVSDPEMAKCVLGDLKIFSKPMLSNASVADDNCMLVSPGMIESLKIKEYGNNVDVVYAIIAHESMHLLQKNCTHANEVVYRIGHSYKFEDMSIHPLFNNWFYEGAAERLVVNYTHYIPVTYSYYIYYINSMTLSCVLNPDNSLYALEESTFSVSIDPLFRYFGCATKDEETEIRKMLFSLEFIETDDPEFMEAVDPNMTEDTLISIKRQMKNSVCETMAKHFYKNLAEKLSKEAVPLNDVFYYITVFEHDVNSHILFTDPQKKADAAPFIRNYTAIQDQFFALLAENGDYTPEQIAARFASYGLVTEAGEKNFSLPGLPAEKQAFLSSVLVRTYAEDFDSIRSFGE